MKTLWEQCRDFLNSEDPRGRAADELVRFIDGLEFPPAPEPEMLITLHDADGVILEMPVAGNWGTFIYEVEDLGPMPVTRVVATRVK